MMNPRSFQARMLSILIRYNVQIIKIVKVWHEKYFLSYFSGFWNIEVKNFQQLKLATTFHYIKTVLKENYRPVNLLPVVTNIFERVMEDQMKSFIAVHLSIYLCGYRKKYNLQYAMTFMIEKWTQWHWG